MPLKPAKLRRNKKNRKNKIYQRLQRAYLLLICDSIEETFTFSMLLRSLYLRFLKFHTTCDSQGLWEAFFLLSLSFTHPLTQFHLTCFSFLPSFLPCVLASSLESLSLFWLPCAAHREETRWDEKKKKEEKQLHWDEKWTCWMDK